MRALFGLIAGLLIAGSAAAETPLERGSYLVNGILTCGNCHTPRGAGGALDMSRQLSGGPQVFDEEAFTVRGANLTPDPETGLGTWSADDLKHTLLTGVRPSGVPLATAMPYAFYKVFTPGDLEAVVTYLRSVPAVHNAVQPPVYKAAVQPVTPPGAEQAMSETDLADPLKRGFYLATIGHCMECHTPTVSGRSDFSRMGAGGREFKGPWGVVMSRNITSDKEKGIGDLTDAEIKRAITHGIRKDGTRLKGPMGFTLYATMTDGDLDSLVRYLRTVPARR